MWGAIFETLKMNCVIFKRQSSVVVCNVNSWNQTLTSVTLGTFLTLSVPLFPHLKMEIIAAHLGRFQD